MNAAIRLEETSFEKEMYDQIVPKILLRHQLQHNAINC